MAVSKGWYADPIRRRGLRYWDGDAWSAWVSDHGEVRREVPSPLPARPRRHARRSVWIAAGIVLAVVAVLLVGVGLDQALRDLGTYRADLTAGGGDFVAKDIGSGSTRYRGDGYHLLVRDPETWLPSGVKAPSAMRSMSVEVAATTRRSAVRAAFGPFCWRDPTHGYGFVVGSAGDQELVVVDGSYGRQDVSVIASAAGATRGVPARLTLSCSITGSPLPETVELVGYVGNTRTITATTDVVVSTFRYSGFAGRTDAVAPAEWVVTRFSRRRVAE
jgi:hypothetical protein